MVGFHKGTLPDSRLTLAKYRNGAAYWSTSPKLPTIPPAKMTGQQKRNVIAARILIEMSAPVLPAMVRGLDDIEYLLSQLSEPEEGERRSRQCGDHRCDAPGLRPINEKEFVNSGTQPNASELPKLDKRKTAATGDAI
jgi:hypothetical protein